MVVKNNESISYKEMWRILHAVDMPIYIAGHLKPDQDSFCSSLALSKILTKLEKETNVLLLKKDKSEFNWINDVEFFNVTEKIIHDEYVFIALDLNEKKRLGIFEKFFDEAKIKINIDHHQNNKYEADYTITNPSASSTCQMIYELAESNEFVFINKEISELLYSGMMNDTNCFSRRLDENTFSVAQKLINNGVDYSKIIKQTYAGRSLYEVKAFATAVNEIEYLGFHYIVIDKTRSCYSGLSHNQIVKKLAEDLRKINEIDVFLVLIKEDDKIIAKIMTNTSSNANVIAEIFGGGGHAKEAGFTVKMSEKEIIKKVKEYIESKH